MKILAIGAEAQEINPWLRACPKKTELHWPIANAFQVRWNGATLYAVSNGPGPHLAKQALETAVPVTSEAAGPVTTEAAIEVLLQAAQNDPDVQLLPWLEREFTIYAMKATKANQVRAAKLLGITRATLRKRIERFGITKELTIS